MAIKHNHLSLNMSISILAKEHTKHKSPNTRLQFSSKGHTPTIYSDEKVYDRHYIRLREEHTTFSGLKRGI